MIILQWARTIFHCVTFLFLFQLLDFIRWYCKLVSNDAHNYVRNGECRTSWGSHYGYFISFFLLLLPWFLYILYPIHVSVRNRQSHNIVLITNMTLRVFFLVVGWGGGVKSLYCIFFSYRRSLRNLRNDSCILEQTTDGEYLSLWSN